VKVYRRRDEAYVQRDIFEEEFLRVLDVPERLRDQVCVKDIRAPMGLTGGLLRSFGEQIGITGPRKRTRETLVLRQGDTKPAKPSQKEGSIVRGSGSGPKGLEESVYHEGEDPENVSKKMGKATKADAATVPLEIWKHFVLDQRFAVDKEGWWKMQRVKGSWRLVLRVLSINQSMLTW